MTMKRKLDKNDVPVEVSANHSKIDMSFQDFALDPRLLQALAQLNYAEPTPIQQHAIPLALDGRHLVARAGTGTGKTAAYLLPLLQSILSHSRATNPKTDGLHALILVPTRELAAQVIHAITDLTMQCSNDVSSVNISSQNAADYQRTMLVASPRVVVSTLERAVAHLSQGSLHLDQLKHLVIDEADLMLSYGHQDDFQEILKHLPSGVQTFLASATINPDVEMLKKLFADDPVVLDLSKKDQKSQKVLQYSVTCGEQEKYLILFALLKLKLIQGKSIIFAASVDRCYHLKLFLQSFGLSSCVLNSELPVNCRTQIVSQFNDGTYSTIIATDEHEVFGSESDTGLEIESADRLTGETRLESKDGDATEGKKDKTSKAKQKPRRKRDKEYGIARGIDFQNVTCVLNFDLPTSRKSYVHRIGRTARAGRGGTAISLAVARDQYRKHKSISNPNTRDDEITLSKIVIHQREQGHDVRPYHFDMQKLSAFRYRVASALKATTPASVRQARLDELRQELLRSEKLKRHLEENPDDLKYLRHDTSVKAGKIQPHLRHVPDYLLPGKRKSGIAELVDHGESKFVELKKPSQNRIRKARERNKMKGKARAVSSVKSNPLKFFKG